MSISEELRRVTSVTEQEPDFEPDEKLASALVAMLAGLRAAVEYERLRRMSDGQLAECGLRRQDLLQVDRQEHGPDPR